MFRGIVTREQWGAIPPKSKSAMGPAEGVTIHWEGTTIWANRHDASDHAYCYTLIRGIQRYHMSGVYSDIAYNYVACIHGYLFVGRGPGVANGANGTTWANTHSYAICALLGPGDPVTQDLKDALAFGATGIRLWVGAGQNDHCHRDWVQTGCPGDTICAWVKSGGLKSIGETATPVPPTSLTQEQIAAIIRYIESQKTTVVAPPFPGRYISYPPVTYGDDVRMWQQQMRNRGWNISVDGAYGQQSQSICIAFQREKSLVADGVIGPATWKCTWECK